MKFKHRITIKVQDDRGNDAAILNACDMKLPKRLIRWLFGDFQQIYLINPGQSIAGIDIQEVSHE